jgi:hypothetical protein
MWSGIRSFEGGHDCFAHPELLMTNWQYALGQFSIGRVGQFSNSANTIDHIAAKLRGGPNHPREPRKLDLNNPAPGY